MLIRPYRSEDCRGLAALFYETVHCVNAADYTPEQLDVWATGQVDLVAWDASFLAHRTLVAEIGGVLAGFADMDEGGYLDRLYVHKDFQRRGVAAALCDALEGASPVRHFTTHASITARPFFEKQGYRVVKEQTVLRRGGGAEQFRHGEGPVAILRKPPITTFIFVKISSLHRFFLGIYCDTNNYGTRRLV